MAAQWKTYQSLVRVGIDQCTFDDSDLLKRIKNFPTHTRI